MFRGRVTISPPNVNLAVRQLGQEGKIVAGDGCCGRGGSGSPQGHEHRNRARAPHARGQLPHVAVPVTRQVQITSLKKDMAGRGRIQADGRAGIGAQKAASVSAPEVPGGAEGVSSTARPFHSIAPSSAPGAALFREGRRRRDGATGTTAILVA
jgi:hypothetical protein